MVSEISNIGRGGAGVVVMRPSTPAPASSQAPGSSAIQIPETPKVLAPKPVAIKFDASEVRQNLQDAVSMLNQQMSSTKRGLGFQIDEAVGGHHAVKSALQAGLQALRLAHHRLHGGKLLVVPG